mgnify:CR=1 FL=1
MPYPKNGDTYGYIKFTTDDIDKVKIPYGKIFGGSNMYFKWFYRCKEW